VGPHDVTSIDKTELVCQGVRRDPIQYHANMFDVIKRARAENKIFLGSFLEYDF
jgi:hypothetical protein